MTKNHIAFCVSRRRRAHEIRRLGADARVTRERVLHELRINRVATVPKGRTRAHQVVLVVRVFERRLDAIKTICRRRQRICALGHTICFWKLLGQSDVFVRVRVVNGRAIYDAGERIDALHASLINPSKEASLANNG